MSARDDFPLTGAHACCLDRPCEPDSAALLGYARMCAEIDRLRDDLESAMSDATTAQDRLAATEFLTGAELRAMDLTVALVHVVCREVIGIGPTREHDVAEFVAAIHHVQASILSQAAGRAHPDRFRLLGETLNRESWRDALHWLHEQGFTIDVTSTLTEATVRARRAATGTWATVSEPTAREAIERVASELRQMGCRTGTPARNDPPRGG